MGTGLEYLTRDPFGSNQCEERTSADPEEPAGFT